MPTNLPQITNSQRQALRSWLKLLGASNMVRKSLQSMLQTEHGVSLSRFDVMANLYRAPKGGVRLTELSKQLMVSNGNVTQVMAPLVKEGLVERKRCPDDARAATACLSKKGKVLFETMAVDHAAWVGETFAKLTSKDHEDINRIIEKLATVESPNDSLNESS